MTYISIAVGVFLAFLFGADFMVCIGVGFVLGIMVWANQERKP